MKSRNKTKFITHAAIIAALYVVLTYLTSLFGLASGPVQCRLSEALCILPVFTPAAVPGLFVGCLLSNLLTGGMILDVVFGSIATLIGAAGTYCLAMRKANKYLYTLPAVVSNTLIIPLVLKYAYALDGALWYFIITVCVGEIISCGVLGMLLYFSLSKKASRLFK